MHRAQQIIAAVDVIDVDYVRVSPSHGPWLNDHKPITAILEARSSGDNNRVADLKGVLPAKISPKTVFRNTTAFFSFPLLSVLFLIRRFLVLPVFLHSLLVVFFFLDLFVVLLLVLVYLLVFLFLRMVRFFVRRCPLFFLRMRLVLGKDGCRNSKKYSQCGCAENCQ